MTAKGAIFGPVSSRRLGRSLGVDLVPLKTCTYDCIYCQLGRTTAKTIERRPHAAARDVLDELDRRLSEGVEADHVTIGGSGEPTLNSGLGEILSGVKRLTAIPVAVLTNGALLWQPEVRRDLAPADLVLPSLDAGNAGTFARVNRPHEGIAFDRMVAGLVEFGRSFRGEVWLEVFLLAGINDGDREIEDLRPLLERIRPRRVHLNSVARPPAEPCARAVAAGRLAEIAARLGPLAEVIAERPVGPPGTGERAAHEEVLALLARRPSTVEQVAEGLGFHPAEAAKAVAALLRDGRIISTEHQGKVYHAGMDAPGGARTAVGDPPAARSEMSGS